MVAEIEKITQQSNRHKLMNRNRADTDSSDIIHDYIQQPLVVEEVVSVIEPSVKVVFTIFNLLVILNYAFFKADTIAGLRIKNRQQCPQHSCPSIVDRTCQLVCSGRSGWIRTII